MAIVQTLLKLIALAAPVIVAVVAVNDWRARVTIIIGFVSPLIIKYAPRPWKDHWMALTVFVGSFLVAAAVSYLEGTFKGFDTSSAVSVGTAFVQLYAVQQYVFSAFKTSLNLPDPGPPPLKTIGVG